MEIVPTGFSLGTIFAGLSVLLLTQIRGGRRRLLLFGPSADLSFTLPAGEREDDFRVNTVVEVFDIFGAITQYNLPSVTVSGLYVVGGGHR